MEAAPEAIGGCVEVQLTPDQLEHERQILIAHDELLQPGTYEEMQLRCNRLYFLITTRERVVTMALENARYGRIFSGRWH